MFKKKKNFQFDCLVTKYYKTAVYAFNRFSISKNIIKVEMSHFQFFKYNNKK